MSRHVHLLLLFAALLLARGALAQECVRPPCSFGEVDADGCCPTKRPASRAAAPTPAPAKCSGGKEVSPDTAGHCCWAGQAWGSGQCVGIPTSCPNGLVVNLQTCEPPACGAGQVRANDAVHCCWPAQAWSTVRSVCVGIPKCPAGTELEGNDRCSSSDRDNDGIPNAVDKCPDQPEDKNGFEDADGCPDEPRRLAAVAQQQRLAQAAEQQQRDVLRKAQEAKWEQDRRAAAAAELKRQADEAARLAAEREQHEREERADLRRRRRITGYVFGSVGVVFGVTSFVFMAKGSSEDSDIKGGMLPTAVAVNSAVSTGQTDNTIAIATGVVGILGAVVGGILVLSALPESAPQPARAGVWLGPGSLMGRF